MSTHGRRVCQCWLSLSTKLSTTPLTLNRLLFWHWRKTLRTRMPCWLKFSVEELSSVRSGFSRRLTASQRWQPLLLIVMVLFLKLEFLVIRKKANFLGDTRKWQDISTPWWNGLDEPTRARVSLVFSFFAIFCLKEYVNNIYFHRARHPAHYFRHPISILLLFPIQDVRGHGS